MQPVEDLEGASQECFSWRATIKQSIALLNKQAQVNETSRKDEMKRRGEQQLCNTKNGLHCDYPGCSFLAITNAGLINHQCQCHVTNSRIQRQFCHQMFNKQGVYNHQRFCSARPSPPM